MSASPVHDAQGDVAIIGSGAVGLSLASALSRAGHRVTVCGARLPFDQIRITTSGEVHSSTVEHIHESASAPRFRTIVVAVKSHHTDDVASWLRHTTGPGSTVIVAQNGVEQKARVERFVNSAEVVPMVVYLNAERTGPGEVTLRHVGDVDLAVADDEPGRRVTDALRRGGMRVAAEADFVTTLWAKLLTNVTANPLTALTGRRAEVIRDTEIGNLARRLMLETALVARAEGAHLTDADVDHALTWLRHVPEGATTSMREDRLTGRPLEADALTGAVVRAARRHGVAVPVNEMILTLLTAIRPETSQS